MNSIKSNLVYASLFRRLFAIFYDGFLLAALLFIVSAIATALNKGQAVEPGNLIYPFFILALVGASYLYFAWFWVHGGQTLGMKTWRIQLQINDTDKIPAVQIDWKRSAIRFFGAMLSWCFLGIGFVWALFDKKNRCWHDLLSKTVLIDIRSNTN